MAGLGFLQTTGIASQASDQFDTARQQRRIASQHEQMNQSQLDDNALYREIVKMAYEHESAKEAAAAAAAKTKAKGPIAPTAPVAPGSVPAAVPAIPLLSAGFDGEDGPNEEGDFANGGALKFNGIYDDAKSGKRMPTHFHEAFEDWEKPGYKHGGSLQQTVHELIHHVNSYADGGPLSDPSIPDTGEEDKKKLADELLSVGVASPEDVNATVPGLKVTPGPNSIPGRLQNIVSGTNLFSQGGNTQQISAKDSGGFEVSGSAPIGGGAGASGQGGQAGDADDAGAPPGGLATAIGLTGLTPAGLVAGMVAAANAATANAANTAAAEAAAAAAADADSAEGAGGNAGTGVDSGEGNAEGGNAAASAAAAAAAAAAASEGNGPGDDGGSGSGAASSGAAAGADGGAAAGGDGGSAGGDGFKSGGVLWNHVKAVMSKKSKPRAVKFKNGGKTRSGPGGQVRGRGTGTSDSVPASLSGPSGSKRGINLSNGEYVLSADTVSAVGKPQLDKLQARYHKQMR